MTCAAAAARIEPTRATAPEPTAQGRPRRPAPRFAPAAFAAPLAPTAEAREVDLRAAEIAEETGARGRTGRILARRAAAMSLRMEHAEGHAWAVAASRAQAARDEFDRERSDALETLIAELEGGDDPRLALAELETLPDGVRFLAESWADILKGLRADPGADDGRARRRLGLDGAAERSPLIERGEAELARLRRLAVELHETAARTIAADRHQAGVLASFDPSPEGERARRHEASAERSFHRALKAIAEHRAATADLPTPTPAIAPPPPVHRPTSPPAAARLGSFPPPGPIGLGPIRLDAPAPALDDLFGPVGRRSPAPGTPEARRDRPDPARLVASRR